MPGFIGKKLCPDLVIVKPNFTKYRKVSQQVREVLMEYDPLFAPMGLDEAYLDLTNYVTELIDKTAEDDQTNVELDNSYWECALNVVSEIREKIHQKTQLTASAGIAVNVMLAKIASDVNKPNGQYFIPPTQEKILQFIRPLSIRKVNKYTVLFSILYNRFQELVK